MNNVALFALLPRGFCLAAWTLCLSIGPGAGPAAGAESETPTGTLRGTVRDAVTGLPAPCTVTIVDAKGKTLIERESFRGGFRCGGRFTNQVAAGPARVRVVRGFETRAIEREVVVPAGGEAEVQFRLERVVDLRKRGWFAGDSHAHMIHGERTIPVDFDFVALSARAEDLHYLSLSHAWDMESPTPEKLEQALGSRSTPDCWLTWNLEAPKNYYLGDAGRCLGHCWTVGMRGRTASGQDVIPLLLQASAQDYESSKPRFANFESHALIRAQGGAVFYSHPARWWMGAWGGQGGYPRREQMRVSNLAVELPLDTLLGPTYDGLDILTGAGEFQANAQAFALWSLLLNHGYRLAATASSDACFDRPGGAVPGVVRTYTRVDGPFSIPAAAEAMARGCNFVTTGPLLLASVDGCPPGFAFETRPQARKIEIEAWASGTDSQGLSRLEILRNGEILHSQRFTPGIPSLRTNVLLPAAESAWYCARVFGGDPRRQQVITGAFFFENDDWRPPAPVPARVRVRLEDAATSLPLAGSVTEVSYQGPLPQSGRRHTVSADGAATLTVPATVRLRAEAPGYRALTLSPVLDSPALVEQITRLSAEDLLKWETYERTRALLGEIALVFRLEPTAR